MARLVSKSGQGVLTVPDNMVAEALAANPDLALDSSVSVDGGSGFLSPEAYTQVAGNPAFAQADNADTAFAQAQQAQLEDVYGSQNLNAAGAGLTRGLTLGLSDVLLANDPDAKFEAEQLRTQNNIISTASEIGGALAPALFTGGESLFAGALRATPSGLVTRAGMGAAERIAGEGVAVKALQAATQGVVEGAGMGLGNSITNAALHDDPFTVESVASNMALGAVLGGATGGALGAAGAGIGKALGRAKPLSVTSSVDEMSAGFGAVRSKADDLVTEYKATIEPRLATPGTLAAEKRAAASVAGKHGAAARWGNSVDDVFRDTGAVPLPGMQQKLFQHVEGNLAPAAGAPDELLTAFRKADKALRREVGDELDFAQILTANAPRARAIAQHVDDYVKAVSAMDDKLGGKYGVQMDIGEAALGQKLADAGITLPPVQTGELAQAMGKGGNEKFLQWLEAAAPQTRMLLQAREMARTVGPEAVAARSGVFKKMLTALGVGFGRNFVPAGMRGQGVVASSMRGGVRQLGGLIGGRAMQALLGGPGKVAVLAAGATGYVGGKVTLGAAKAVQALSKPAGRKAITAASILGATSFGRETDKDPSRARMKEIAAAVANPSTERLLSQAVIPLHLQNPVVAEQVKLALQTRLQYLAERSPWKQPERALRHFKVEPTPSRYEVAKWARIVRAAENPLSLLEDLETRQLTPEAVSTVRDLYPETFARMQSAVLEQVSESGKSLSYQARLQVAAFFDTPIDASQTPEFGATIQGMYTQAAQPQGPGPAQSTAAPKVQSTQTQRLLSPM